MEELAVMDYSTGEIHIYMVSPEVDIDDEYIQNVLGFNLDECYWMCGTSIPIIKHNNIIK